MKDIPSSMSQQNSASPMIAGVKLAPRIIYKRKKSAPVMRRVVRLGDVSYNPELGDKSIR